MKEKRRKKTFNFGCNRCVSCNIMPKKIKPSFLFCARKKNKKESKKLLIMEFLMVLFFLFRALPPPRERLIIDTA